MKKLLIITSLLLISSNSFAGRITGGGGSSTAGSGTVSTSSKSYVAYYAADGTVVVGTNTIVISSGNVGIGTTAPQSILHVLTSSAATTGITVQLGTFNGANTQFLKQVWANGNNAGAIGTQGTSWNVFGIWGPGSNLAGPPNMAISVSEIGVTVPIRNTSSSLTLKGNTSSGNPDVLAIPGAANRQALRVSGFAGQTERIFEVTASTTTDKFFTVGATGNVSIGTNTNTDSLYIYNKITGNIPNVVLDHGTSLTGSSGFLFKAEGATTGGIKQNKSTNDLTFLTSTTANAITILDGGNVGISSTAPVAKLSVSGNAIFTGNVTASNAVFGDGTNVSEIKQSGAFNVLFGGGPGSDGFVIAGSTLPTFSIGHSLDSRLYIRGGDAPSMSFALAGPEAWQWSIDGGVGMWSNIPTEFADVVTISSSMVTGPITMTTASVLNISSGTNTRAGNLTLVAGTKTVSNTTVTSNTIVMLTRKTSGGTTGTAINYTVSAGASFTVTSNNALDTSTFSYFLIENP